jgi:hypothetical protein
LLRLNPRNFDYDHIGNAMLAMFEIVQFKGWIVVRDIILNRQGAVSLKLTACSSQVFFWGGDV